MTMSKGHASTIPLAFRLSEAGNSARLAAKARQEARGGQMKRTDIALLVAASIALAGAQAAMADGEPANADEARAVFKNAPPKSSLPPSKGADPQQQHLRVKAQEAAARAPDTASADAAKKRVLQQGASESKGIAH